MAALREPGGMPDAAWLRATEEIKQLKARYFRGVDRKDRALLESAFCTDVICDFSQGMEDPQGADGQRLLAESELLCGAPAAATAIIAAVADLVTVHHGHMPEITITGPDTASGIWSMMDRLRFPQSSDIDEIEGWGFYEETYRREEGEWKIHRLRLERLRVDVRRRR
jgi:hypothetical protein